MQWKQPGLRTLARPGSAARIMWPGEKVGSVRLEFSDDQVMWRPASGDLAEVSERWGKALRMQYFSFAARGRYVRATITAVPDRCPVAVQELELYRE